MRIRLSAQVVMWAAREKWKSPALQRPQGWGTRVYIKACHSEDKMPENVPPFPTFSSAMQRNEVAGSYASAVAVLAESCSFNSGEAFCAKPQRLQRTA